MNNCFKFLVLGMDVWIICFTNSALWPDDPVTAVNWSQISLNYQPSKLSLLIFNVSHTFMYDRVCMNEWVNLCVHKMCP